jgi:hypothetical protein
LVTVEPPRTANVPAVPSDGACANAGSAATISPTLATPSKRHKVIRFMASSSSSIHRFSVDLERRMYSSPAPTCSNVGCRQRHERVQDFVAVPRGTIVLRRFSEEA